MLLNINNMVVILRSLKKGIIQGQRALVPLAPLKLVLVKNKP